jgi:signal transduction histidine kinase
MREEFLSTAAHEFKTPLAVVKAYAQLMARREPAEAQALAVIQRQVDRLSRLVQHLLDTSRLRLEGDTGHRERFDLAALAGEVLERARAAAPTHALRLEAPGPAAVVADRERIARVLTSLVDNAVRFSPSGGVVEARVEADGEEATVSVRDHGLGIPPDRQAHVFERYYRAHAGTPDDYGGLGLGLDMSREIVRRHGGRMWFESAPGAGSTFHFSLPLARRPS